MIDVACVWVKANVPYGEHYLTRLARMLARESMRNVRLHIFTDRALSAIKAVEGIIPATTHRVELPAGVPGWWGKMHLFNPIHFGATRPAPVIYVDLDTLILPGAGFISGVLECGLSNAFTACKSGGAFVPKTRHSTFNAINTSIMAWWPGQMDWLWSAYAGKSRAHIDAWWGDQDFIGHALYTRQFDYSTFPSHWFPRASDIDWTAGVARWGDATARAVLCKKPKNDILCATVPGFNHAWGGV